MQFSEISPEQQIQQLEFLYNDIRIEMNLRNATFMESKIDKVIKDIDKHTMFLPDSPLPLEDTRLKGQVGQVEPELIGLLVYTVRSYDIRKKKINPKYIRVHKLCQLGSFINTTLYDLYQKANSSSNRQLLDLATNEIKDLIQKRSPPYEFNTISKGQSLIASFRTPQHFGRQLIATTYPYRSDLLSEKVIQLEKKYNALVEKNKKYEKSFDNISHIILPSVVIISIKENRFDLILDALMKANNMEVLEVFRTLEKQFDSVDLECFTIKPEKYTAFAFTQDASKKLIHRFIVDPDGKTILNPDTSALRKVMEYHVVAGELKFEDIKKKSSLKSYNGLSLVVRTIGDDLYINNSKIVEQDLLAANGVVHIIDNLLVPD